MSCSDEAGPYQTPAEMEIEFGSLPEEFRLAALEYARGLSRLREFEPEPFQPGDVPDFIMVGLNGRTLFYSMSVTTSKFAQRMTGIDMVPITSDPRGPKARVPRMSIVVGVEMGNFEQIHGDSYQDALRTLLGEMSRRQESRERAGRRQRELPPGI